MTTQKQLSHLSFAAIMLVFVALPALAQTGSVDKTAVATTSNLVESSEVAALRKACVSIPTKESRIVVAPTTATEKPPSFSLNQFVKVASEPAIISDPKVFEFSSLEKPAFNETSANSIQFVPSRGPKLPWQQ